MKLDKKIKHKWLKALRSGKYEQGTGTLKSVAYDGTATYCCLGVLCDVVNPRGWTDGCHTFGCSGELSLDFQEKIGMTGAAMRKLIVMNDGGDDVGADFKEIASYISRNL
jgi:hypothetical protein